jgi:cobaltochelatase CobS
MQAHVPLPDPVSDIPDTVVSVRDRFGIDWDVQAPAFSAAGVAVPEIDEHYVFDGDATRAILAGFIWNRRVLVHGYHGTGKSTHIEQIAARLNWPCIRLNFDAQIGRIDLLGRDAIVIKDGLQVTEFVQGILPWALQRAIALVLDEYDAGRPEVMFVIQRVLEANGQLNLLEQNCIVKPHPAFRLFATANTIGLGDSSGLYHGTQLINQAQLDRWQIVVALDYLPHAAATALIVSKLPRWNTETGRRCIAAMVSVAELTRRAFLNGDTSTLMSQRTVLVWAENAALFDDIGFGFRVSFLNRCESAERPIFAEFYQRYFDEELPGSLSDARSV